MISSRSRNMWQRLSTSWIAAMLLVPMFVTFTPPAHAQLFGKNPNQPAPQKKGMSTGQKVLLIGGAALLYYLYRKHQASVAAKQANTGTMGNSPQNVGMAQLYRSRNGGVYYRDAQHNPVWLTVPQQAVQVSAQDVQRYAPDYNQYQGPAPAAPRGYRTQPFNDFNSRMFNRTTTPNGNGVGGPPGPGQF